jgi:transposase
VLRGKDVNDIIELKRQGLPISQISQLTGYSRPTIRKYLDNPAAPRYGPRPLKGSKVEPFKPYLEERLSAGVWNAVVLLAEIKSRGYSGEYTALKDYLRPLRKQARTVAVRRFETPPGHQAQLDWGELGHLETAGSRKTLYGFVFTLGHSRALFADVATDTRIATLLRLHEAAFAELGGIPREILYDRMKTVVLGTDERGETKWNPLFLDFAQHWGFTPRACRAYRPQTKGKVESGVGYLRKNFLCGREAGGLADLRGQLRTWVWQVANQRVHGTTHQHIFSAWQKEKPYLLPLVAGRATFPYAAEEKRKVSRDAFVSFQGNRYSVPWRVAGQEVLLRESDGQLLIHRGGERLAVHLLCSPGGHQAVTVAAHHEGIPFGFSERGGKARICVHAQESDLPVVEVRSLLAYDMESSMETAHE